MGRKKSFFVSVGIVGVAFVSTAFSLIGPLMTAQALTGSDWHAGRIIDDSVFNYSNAMSVPEIQNLLNAKVPTCDNWGTQIYSGTTTRRAYSESKGVVFPLTCVKDYYENPTTHQNNLSGQPIPAGGLSAAQIIWQAGQQYSINPEVLITLLQKEQSLMLDDWPWPIQYQSATGYGCPDTAACDSSYYGFYNQVTNAAKQFRRYANQPNSYNFITGNNNIQYNPNSSCGSSVVYIENQATASLYNYTPYQPNQAALNNLYGSGDGCSAYGNRNFWRLFNDWFGSTLIFDPFGWQVIKTADDSREYLKVGNTKRWISSGDLYNDWELGSKPIETVSQSFMDSVPTLPPLGRLGIFNGKYYYVDGGKKYWLSNEALQRAWGQFDSLALAEPAYIPLSDMTDGGEATFYIAQGSTQLARLINGQAYIINASDGDRWNANPTSITSPDFSSFNVAASVDYHLLINGQKYMVDGGHLVNVSDAGVARDYGVASVNFVAFPSDIMNFLPPVAGGSLVQLDDGGWYLLRNSQLYYVAKGEIATAWGYPAPPVRLTGRLTQGYTHSATPLSVITQDATTGKIYLLDGTKHLLTGVAADAVQTPGVALQSFASEYLNAVPDGNDITSPLLKTERGDIFTLMNGGLYHVPNGTTLNALGYQQPYGLSNVSSIVVNAIGISGAASPFVKVGAVTYSLENGTAYPIVASAVADWTARQSVSTYTSQNFSARYAVSPQQLDHFIQQNGTKTIVSNGVASPVYSSYINSSQDWKTVPSVPIPSGGNLSYLVRSTDTTDPRVWLVSNGSRQYINSGEEYNAYTKHGTVGVSSLSPVALDTLSAANSAPDISPLLYLDGSGFKLLDGSGRFYGFANADTAVNFINGNTTQTVNAELYQSFNVYRQGITRLVRDPSGKVYWVENGAKRWITNGAAYNRYSNAGLTDIDWNVANWLPNGAAIN